MIDGKASCLKINVMKQFSFLYQLLHGYWLETDDEIKAPDDISLPRTTQVMCMLRRTEGLEDLEQPFQEPVSIRYL